jgi:hypothetical protein
VPSGLSSRTRHEEQLAAHRADEELSALSVIAWAERGRIVVSALPERGTDRLMIERARATIARMAAENRPAQVTIAGVTITCPRGPAIGAARVGPARR